MDINGVPHKINRHVFKAVNFLGDCSNFSNIYNYVKTCTQNLKPVPQLKQTVRKSLRNLKSVGILKMDSRNTHYKLKPKFPNITDNDHNSEGSSNFSPLPRISKRHQIYSDEEDEHNEVENVSKRFKASTKNISRTHVPKKKKPKHERSDLRQKSSSKGRQAETSSSNKANIIYKKIGIVSSDPDGYVRDEPNSNDKDLNNNECETRQSEEGCYKLRSDEEKTKENDNIKPAKSEPEEQLTDDINETSNIDNECQDDTLGIIRRYNYNYLN